MVILAREVTIDKNPVCMDIIMPIAFALNLVLPLCCIAAETEEWLCLNKARD